MVKKWFTRYGPTSTSDTERSGRPPIAVATPETIERIHDLVLAGGRSWKSSAYHMA